MVLTAVVKTFGRAGRTVRAVDGIDLSIGRGETVALLGRNGAGKSTAIGLLLGLNEPDSGRVRVLGRTPGRRSGPVWSARCSRTGGPSSASPSAN